MDTNPITLPCLLEHAGKHYSSCNLMQSTIYLMLINVPQCVCALSLGGATGIQQLIAITLKRMHAYKACFKIPFGDLVNSM